MTDEAPTLGEVSAEQRDRERDEQLATHAIKFVARLTVCTEPWEPWEIEEALDVALDAARYVECGLDLTKLHPRVVRLLANERERRERLTTED